LYFHTRSDDYEPFINPDGSLLFSTTMGFTLSELDRLEEKAYDDLVVINEVLPDSLQMSEVMMRAEASDQRRLLEFFEGVMSHLYIFTP